ncbi:MAG: hypothetical protein NTY82_04670 [Actinobacteria bacterium]|nr:hypothetical protein [Actinomycetota bacterium]
MPLIKREFVASNGHVLSYFQSDDAKNKKAHVFWFSAFTRGPLLGKLLRTDQRFHGFKAASTSDDFSFTLVRDDSGLTGDGTYYYGKANNPYIEEAVSELVAHISDDLRKSSRQTRFFGVGSSMGSYAAVKFGILNGLDTALAMVPHFDLVAAGKYCGRKRWIDWATEGSTPTEKKKYMNRLADVVKANPQKLPTLFVQSAKDDVGVHNEQVVPFVELYRGSGGTTFTDFRDFGGHSMINASNEYIHAVLDLLAERKPFRERMFDGFPQRKELPAEKLERHFGAFENRVAKLLGR